MLNINRIKENAFEHKKIMLSRSKFKVGISIEKKKNHPEQKLVSFFNFCSGGFFFFFIDTLKLFSTSVLGDFSFFFY